MADALMIAIHIQYISNLTSSGSKDCQCSQCVDCHPYSNFRRLSVFAKVSFSDGFDWIHNLKIFLHKILLKLQKMKNSWKFVYISILEQSRRFWINARIADQCKKVCNKIWCSGIKKEVWIWIQLLEQSTRLWSNAKLRNMWCSGLKKKSRFGFNSCGMK